MRGQPERDDREGDQDHQPDQVGDDKGDNALEDRRETDVLDHAFYHEHVHSDRRMDQAEFHRHHDDDAEPDRVEAQMRDDREDDRDGEDDHGHGVHQAAEHQIHQHDQRHYAVAPEPETGQQLGHFLRRLRDGEEITEYQRADQHGEHRRGGARGLQQRAQDAVFGQPAAEHADKKGAAGADTAGFRRRKTGQERQTVETADHENEQ